MQALAELIASRSAGLFMIGWLATACLAWAEETTNLPFENWTEVLGGERLTGAVLERFTHRCHIIETTGDSYRLNDPQRKRRTSRKEKSIWPSGRACYNSHATQSQVSDEPRSVFSTLEFHGFWLCENVPP